MEQPQLFWKTCARASASSQGRKKLCLATVLLKAEAEKVRFRCEAVVAGVEMGWDPKVAASPGHLFNLVKAVLLLMKREKRKECGSRRCWGVPHRGWALEVLGADEDVFQPLPIPALSRATGTWRLLSKPQSERNVTFSGPSGAALCSLPGWEGHTCSWWCSWSLTCVPGSLLTERGCLRVLLLLFPY